MGQWLSGISNTFLSINMLLGLLSLTLFFTAPTTYENGSSLTSVDYYIIEFQCNNRDAKQYVINGDSESFIIPKENFGKCLVRMQSDVDGINSVWSDRITRLIKLDKPKRGGFR